MNKNIVEIERVYRPEIEGLRVVAALLVAVYHIWFGRVSGGVDVFFVISGFLITTSILSTINRTGEFKFLPYIAKLGKRLLPSVLVVLSTVVILSFFWLPASIIGKTLKEVIASLFYYQNWQLALSNTDYLDAAQMKTPVEHFWAMSIQGQFYIIWFLIFAFLLFMIKKFNIVKVKNLINFFLASLFICSLMYSIYLTNVNQPFAYFITFTRVWEFALGGLLCLNLSKFKLNSLFSFIIGWLGLIGLILTGIIFDVSTAFPGFVALWPMLCAVMIVVSGAQNNKYSVKRLLGAPIMIKLGGLSFGVYLWHWVILSFYNYHFSQQPSLIVGIGIIFLSLILSYFMTEYIEKPIRQSDKQRKSFKRLTLMASTTIVLIISFFSINAIEDYLHAKNIVDADYPGAMVKEERVDLTEQEPIPALKDVFDDLPVSHLDETNQGLKESDLKIGFYGETENYSHTIALVGSSHSQHWLSAVLEAIKDTDYRVLGMTRSGTRFSTGYPDDDLKGQWVNEVTEYLRDNADDIDLVVSHTTASDTDNDRIHQQMIDKLKEVHDFGIDVLAIRDNPRYEFNVLEALEIEGEEETIQLMNAADTQKDRVFWNHFIQNNDSFYTLDLTEYFKVDGEFRPIIGNIVVYRDEKHMTRTFSESFGPIFLKKFKEIFE
ncbi:acyltransferase family protein [Gracilibacillus alcaliphilus]|uniref:acyltransferase family protein n=1 Tax=Gracilibacillus alcaliphilus TaxID=1401441 RepID=UPI0019577E51|nr:acyltransferase family protein [Gracilibacillus alcaliphilus]MBM7678421.1 peptidoglycan/LPS O-acetylase OafA/YrhL [Gracilibacillus alcaliphilus]